MAFRTKIRVRFGDVDRAGIAYYPKIFDYFHLAFEDFWERYMGVPYPHLVTEEHLGFPTIRAEADFRKPLRYGEELGVTVFLSRVGGTSATFEYRIDDPRGDRCVEARLVTVCVDLRTFTKTSLPQKYRAKLEACRESG